MPGGGTYPVTYNETFKQKLVQRMLLPNARPLATLSKETRVSEATLSRWRQAATLRGMTKERPASAVTQPPQEWSPEAKLTVVVEASGIPDAELGAFLRRKGVHEAQLHEWRAAAMAGLNAPKAAGRSKATSQDAKRIRELERELRRKEKALAEAAALLVLKKKVQEIWGGEDDDTDRRNEK